MKTKKNTSTNASIKQAFEKINSIGGEDLNNVVAIIEKYGRKDKIKTKNINEHKHAKVKSKQVLVPA